MSDKAANRIAGAILILSAVLFFFGWIGCWWVAETAQEVSSVNFHLYKLRLHGIDALAGNDVLCYEKEEHGGRKNITICTTGSFR